MFSEEYYKAQRDLNTASKSLIDSFDTMGALTLTATNEPAPSVSFDDIRDIANTLSDLDEEPMSAWRELFKINNFDMDNGDVLFISKNMDLYIPPAARKHIVASPYIEAGTMVFVNGDNLIRIPEYGSVNWMPSMIGVSNARR